jgi:hypothetical protein
MRFYYLILVILLFSCAKEKQCDIIRDKQEERGNFYFYFRANYYATPQANNINTPGLNSNYVSGKVSEEIYKSYEIGDEYCY